MTAGFDAGDYIDAVQLGIQQGNLRPSLLAPEYFAEIVAIWVFEGAGAGGINPYAQLRRSENAIRLNERRALEGLR
jgi:hypothetical protein